MRWSISVYKHIYIYIIYKHIQNCSQPMSWVSTNHRIQSQFYFHFRVPTTPVKQQAAGRQVICGLIEDSGSYCKWENHAAQSIHRVEDKWETSVESSIRCRAPTAYWESIVRERHTGIQSYRHTPTQARRLGPAGQPQCNPFKGVTSPGTLW